MINAVLKSLSNQFSVAGPIARLLTENRQLIRKRSIRERAGSLKGDVQPTHIPIVASAQLRRLWPSGA